MIALLYNLLTKSTGMILLLLLLWYVPFLSYGLYDFFMQEDKQAQNQLT